MIPIEDSKEKLTPTVRIGMNMKQIKEVVGRFSKSSHFHVDRRGNMDKLMEELDGKAGESHSSFHLPMTFAYSSISSDVEGKPDPAFFLYAYTWGYNYQTEIRVTKFENKYRQYKGITHRFTLSLVTRWDSYVLGQHSESEVPYLYELLRDWIINDVSEFKPIDWHSEEHPWNWKESSNEDEVEA